MRRLSLWLSALSILAAGLFSSACNLQWSPYAARVGSQQISNGQLDAALSHASRDDAFRCLLVGSSKAGYRLSGSGSNTYDSSFVAFVLTDLIDSQVASDVVRSEHLSLPATARRLAHTQVASALENQARQRNCPVTSTHVLAGLGSALSSSFVRLQLDEDALAAHAAHVGLDRAGIASFERSHASLTEESCLTGIFVKTPAEAAAIESKVAGGTSFSSLVSTYAKSATSSAGALGCFTLGQLQQISPAISAVVGPGKTGQVLKPVFYQSSGGSAHLVLEITSRRFVPFATALNELFSAESAAFARAIVRETERLHISVDSRYGTWEQQKALPKNAAGGFGGRVSPGRGPSLALVLNPAAVKGTAIKSSALPGLGGA